jgi:hypothetical protein
MYSSHIFFIIRLVNLEFVLYIAKKVSKNVYNSTYCYFCLKQILVLKRGVYFLNMQWSVHCSKGTGSPDENLLKA